MIIYASEIIWLWGVLNLNAPGEGLINPRVSMCGKNINTTFTVYKDIIYITVLFLLYIYAIVQILKKPFFFLNEKKVTIRVTP